ncbi:MAG: translocation/assembly module TamB, partial [Odoribacter sp.]|nr:translocation/assembly module TamB [Odoribacter sp.]
TRFLKVRGIGFRYITADVVSRKRAGLRVGLQGNRPYFGTVKLDSLRLGAWQSGKSLVYSANAGSTAEEWKGLFNVNLSGRIVDDRLRLELRQKDGVGNVGFDLGANLVMQDSVFVIGFFPMNPVLGYERWTVNEDNRVALYSGGRIKANLNMTSRYKEISVQSLPDEGNQRDRLQVKINGVDLRKLSQIAPFMPSLGGILHTDVLLYAQKGMMEAEGVLGVTEMSYDAQRIGTVDLGLRYAGKDGFSRHAVEFELGLDSIRRAVVKGEFATAVGDRSVAVDADIPSLPMYVANAFLPPGVMELGGELTGKLRFRGTLDKPELNGQFAFREGTAKVAALGTTFRLDSIPLPVVSGKVVFKKYRFIAPNNSALVLDGEIRLTPFDRMGVDMEMKANNFEAVNVKKNESSLVYGKGYLDMGAKLAGAFDNLNITGNVHLLNTTALTYVLKSSNPTLTDKSADLVRFVSFRDSTQNEADEMTNQVAAGSFSMRMAIEIGDQVNVGVDFSSDGTNQVSIQGGGTLMLVMNPENGMTLSGKYILTGGTVMYNVPIVGKKVFNIRPNSFVEWTGDVMNPLLGISASEQIKANVEDGEQSRQVVFEAIIRIQNSLSRPDITFDLSAPNDMVVQNQLATFSPEERTRQALNLLIYNTYTAPGAAKSNAGTNVANNALYSFVENELNKYTRKAGLTVGFDSHNTEDNMTRTDVTYQFSKQLFNDRVRVKIGGRISTDANENQGGSLQDNLVDDISIEYVLTRKRNLYLKVFRHSNYESVLEGEVTQTGVGVVWRKNFRKFKDLFKNKNREERQLEKAKKHQVE